ncbi:TRAP transporter substrate-binding protein [Limoniibacter endophyticus]|uniref:Periplasmic substrate-binding transporter n=1 Tax=Limoniibacter endophyticus TaxID=1565040 RepID=A0A8J3DLH2_9HYPH|nr:TRAP transporter substrate-binding protein [Limoniibacter endophyticus]GHC67692.1 periplasmic substrate-binding transporter [Limoniibacter endophyticus]
MKMLIGRMLAFTLVAGSAFAAHAQTTDVKIAYALARDSHYGVAADAWEKSVGEATNGKFKFTHFPSSAQGGEREVIEGLQLGTGVQAAVVSSGTLANFVPETGVTDIPFLFRDLAHARAVLDGPIGQGILEKFPDSGLIAVSWGEQGFRHITNNRLPIEKPQDMAGLKIRTMENPVHITAFQTLGAAPTPMSWTEVISGLEGGTIDGQENPLSVIVSAKLWEVQKYLTLSGHVYSPAMLIVSPSFWNELSDDEKTAFKNGAAEALKAMRVYVDDAEVNGAKKAEESGMQVNTLSAEQKAEFQKSIQSAYENSYYKTYGKELIEQIQNTK